MPSAKMPMSALIQMSSRGVFSLVARKLRVNSAPKSPVSPNPAGKARCPQIGQLGQRNSLPRPFAESWPVAMPSPNST